MQDDAKDIFTLYFGSNNPHKVGEINAILPREYRLLTPKDVINPPDPEETGDTLEANAILKAVAYHQVTGLIAFADDTGLEVEALNNAPGVFTARYAGEDANYVANYTKLLQVMEGIDNRKARFRTVIALSGWKGLEAPFLFEGVLEGYIATEPRGTKGFGYDPVFVFPEKNLTLAELSEQEKNQISHRKRALDKFVAFLESENK